MVKKTQKSQLAFLYYHECELPIYWIEKRLKMSRDAIKSAIVRWRKKYPNLPIFKDERIMGYNSPEYTDLRPSRVLPHF